MEGFRTRSFHLSTDASEAIDSRSGGGVSFSAALTSALERMDALSESVRVNLTAKEWGILLSRYNQPIHPEALVNLHEVIAVVFDGKHQRLVDKLSKLSIPERIALADQLDMIRAAMSRGESVVIKGKEIEIDRPEPKTSRRREMSKLQTMVLKALQEAPGPLRGADVVAHVWAATPDDRPSRQAVYATLLRLITRGLVKRVPQGSGESVRSMYVLTG
jgi:hypothetical protein